MLEAVLRYHQPREWQATSYADCPYRLFDVADGSEEYLAVTTPFTASRPALTLTSLRRVQNPFQLGRLIVRREQRGHRGECVSPHTYYHPLALSDLDKALEFNMDVRRYLSRCDRQHNEYKNPVFFSTPGAAFSAGSECAHKVICVCHVLEQNSSSTMTHKNVDTEYMPRYIALVETSQ